MQTNAEVGEYKAETYLDKGNGFELIALTPFHVTVNNAELPKTVILTHLTKKTPGWHDVLVADNLDETGNKFKLKLYNDGAVVFEKEYWLDGLTCLSIDLSNLIQTDYGEISYQGNANFRLYYNYINGGSCCYNLSDEKKSEIFCLFDNFPTTAWKGVTVSNSSDSPINAVLKLISNGQVLATTEKQIPARDTIVGIHSDWFPGFNINQVEKIKVESGLSSLQAIAISGNANISNLLMMRGK